VSYFFALYSKVLVLRLQEVVKYHIVILALQFYLADESSPVWRGVGANDPACFVKSGDNILRQWTFLAIRAILLELGGGAGSKYYSIAGRQNKMMLQPSKSNLDHPEIVFLLKSSFKS